MTNRHEARSLGHGASDLGILARRLRQLQGDPGEFAITAFGGRGLVWADGSWWEIDPIGAGDVDESVAGGVFCMAWVVAAISPSRCREALAYARALRPRRSARTFFVCESCSRLGFPCPRPRSGTTPG